MDVSRLQTYLRQMAATAYGSVPLPGFDLFFHTTNPLSHLNYAIPRPDWMAHSAMSIPALRAAYEARGRLPRLEFVEEFAPDLPATLRDAAFREEYRGPAMACAQPDYVAPPSLPGLQIRRVDSSTRDAVLREVCIAQARGFGADDAWEPVENDIAELSAFLRTGEAFAGVLEGHVVSAAQLAATHGGVTELVGVATLPEYRRRGLATALSAAATAHAFDSGIDTVCLSAGDDALARMYQRVGFRTVATMLAYSRE